MTFRAGTVKPPPPGFYPDIPFAEYLTWDAVNHSLLGWMAHSPEKFLYECLHPGDKETKAKAEGHVFHTCLWEPDQIKGRYAIKPATYPEVNVPNVYGSAHIRPDGQSWRYALGRGKKRVEGTAIVLWDDGSGGYVFAGDLAHDCLTITEKAWRANAIYCDRWAQRQKAAEREVISTETLTTAKLMADRLRDMPDFPKIVEGAQFEVSIVWVDPQTGLLCKARLDCWQPATGQLADAKKTCNSADWEKWARTMLKFSYAGQGAMYRDGVNVLLKLQGKQLPDPGKFRFLVAEDFPPHCPAIYTLADDQRCGSWPWFQHGRYHWHGHLQQVKHCIDADFWPGHNPGLGGLPEEMELDVPEWAKLDGLEMTA